MTRDETQRKNEERFFMLQREMSSLKAMMGKLVEQNSERARQVDTALTTCSFAVQWSYNHILKSLTSLRNSQTH